MREGETMDAPARSIYAGPSTIGLTGVAGSGKDTVADILCREYGFVRMSFASPLKAAVKTMFSLTESHVNGELKEQPIGWLGGVTPRHIMQTLGTEWGREHICDDVWIRVADIVHASILEQNPSARIVITDVRFENEADWVRSIGGNVWFIVRPNAGTSHKHSSESGIPACTEDSVIDNSAGIEYLPETVRQAIRSYSDGEG